MDEGQFVVDAHAVDAHVVDGGVALDQHGVAIPVNGLRSEKAHEPKFVGFFNAANSW